MPIPVISTLTNHELTRFFFAIVLLLSFANIFGYIFHKFKMPRVIGEIFGGIVLGPSIMGAVFPGFFTVIFDAFPSEGKLLSVMYWFGLVLLMFVSGYEIPRVFEKKDRNLISAILIGSTVIPFTAGWLFTYAADMPSLMGYAQNALAFRIVMGIAVAVTSIPVISKIFLDLDIIKTGFAKIVLTASTAHDLILWIALAVATGLVSSKDLSVSGIAMTVAVTLVFFVLGAAFVPRIVAAGNKMRANLLIKSSVFGYTLFICFLFSAIASLLNVNIVFGAFLAGIIIGTVPGDEFENARKSIKENALSFFVPVYFAIVGIRLNFISQFDPKFFILFMLVALAAQAVGTLLATAVMRKDIFTGFNYAVAMNTRGGPGIVLASVAYELGIINGSFFTSIVTLSVLTALLAGVWFKYVLSKGWELAS
ncbi:MAG: cation:proton antiporter [Candidatus Saganbacteria bacterium]|nr:cation:proton antiporter [Candidatus Saganbacteria bacterium]